MTKTNVNKDTILSLAKKLQNSNMKDENNLRDLIKEISNIAGKPVSKEKEDKILLDNYKLIKKGIYFKLQ